MPSIYKIENTVTGQIYVGKTEKTITERMRHHRAKHRLSSSYLHRSMKTYGFDKFNITLLEECDASIIDSREIFWIDKLQSKAPKNFNMTNGGEGGDTSDSLNYKIGMKNRIHPHTPTYGMLGKKHPMKGKSLTKNCCPVVCEGVEYPSVGVAQEAYQGINIRKRLDNEKYPNFYRLKERTRRK